MSQISSDKQLTLNWIDDNANKFTDLSDEIWGYAEPAHREYLSSKAHKRILEEHGFEVEYGLAGMPTAFVAEYGNGYTNIGLFAEYDATPGNSQKPTPYNEPVQAGAAGFEDCHNALGAGSSAAACALKTLVEANSLDATITLFGTPAEKLCTAKSYLARDGHFDDLNAVVGWHPRAYTTVLKEPGPGAYRLFILDYEGVPGYGGKPWSGTSALDANVLTQVLINFMKEHIPRNSYPSITEVVSNGGATPTNLPGSSQLWLGTRSPDLNTLDRMEEMIRRSAEAASMVTGVDHETRRVSATRPWLPNHKMMDIAYRNLELVGPPSFSDEDKEFTRELIRNYNGKEVDEPFDESLSAPDSEVTSGFLGGADDITEFSWHAPTCRINITYQPTVAKGYEIPSWIFSSLSKTNIAHESLITAAKAMSLTAIDLIQHEDELEEAWDEFRQRKRDNDIPLLISENDEPPIDDTIPPYYPEGWEPPVNIG